MVAKFLDLDRDGHLHCRKIEKKVWATVLLLSAIMHRKDCILYFLFRYRILHFIAFWCKLAVLFLNLTRVNNFKWESKNEMSCGSCSQKSSLWKCRITRFTQTFFQTTFSIAQKEAGHLMNPTHWENLILFFFLRFPQKRKKKCEVHDLYVNES